MRRCFAHAGTLLLILLAVSEVGAQQLQPGARIRGQSSAGRFDGRLAWAGRDSLAVASRKDTLVYSMADIRRLDVATGSRRNFWKGVGIGAALGAAVSIPIIIAADDNLDSDLEGLEIAVAGGLLLGSTAVGGITGALIKSPRWTRVRPYGLGLSISF